MSLIMKHIVWLKLAWQWRYLTDKTGFFFLGHTGYFPCSSAFILKRVGNVNWCALNQFNTFQIKQFNWTNRNTSGQSTCYALHVVQYAFRYLCYFVCDTNHFCYNDAASTHDWHYPSFMSILYHSFVICPTVYVFHSYWFILLNIIFATTTKKKNIAE